MSTTSTMPPDAFRAMFAPMRARFDTLYEREHGDWHSRSASGLRASTKRRHELVRMRSAALHLYHDVMPGDIDEATREAVFAMAWASFYWQRDALRERVAA